MARKQKQNEGNVQDIEVEKIDVPYNQTMTVHGIAKVFDAEDIKILEQDFIKKFNINIDKVKNSKVFIVFENGLQVAEIDENDIEIENYLNHNKQQLENWIKDLKETIIDPNLLITLNVGKQNRSYMSYDSYFSQNGLAPKPLIYTDLMSYYKSQNSDLSEEEIALQINGNLKYSFSIKQ